MNPTTELLTAALRQFDKLTAAQAQDNSFMISDVEEAGLGFDLGFQGHLSHNDKIPRCFDYLYFMRYREFDIHPDLAPYIQLIWMMESEKPNEEGAVEQIMPDGIVEFVTHYETPWITTVYGGEEHLQPQSFAISQMRKCIGIRSTGTTGFVSVRFFPWGAHHFFDQPVNQFLDDTIDSKKLWPHHYDQFIANICDAEHDEARIQVLQQFLLEQLQIHSMVDAPLEQAIKMIRESKGKSSIEEVCERTGLSKKQLERKFLTAVGTTPKTFSRLSRFLHVCHQFKDYKEKTLTELSYDCGYFDQAHFIKEFREFSGFTPKEFFMRNGIVFADM